MKRGEMRGGRCRIEVLVTSLGAELSGRGNCRKKEEVGKVQTITKRNEEGNH